MIKYWWFPLLLIGEIADSVISLQGGVDRELNPLMGWVWLNLDFGVVVWCKLLAGLVVLGACWLIHHPKNPFDLTRWIFHLEMVGALAILTGVCFWNWVQIS